MVGILFAALLEILRVGEKIKAPLNVSGKWNINNISYGDNSNDCIGILTNTKNSNFLIDQSGIHLTLIFNNSAKTEMQGKLENNTMTFHKIFSVTNEGIKNCGKRINVGLILKIISDNEYPDKLTGAWYVLNCSECGKINLSAVREQ